MDGTNGLSPEELAAIEEDDQDQTDDLLASVAGEEEGGQPGAQAEPAAAPAQQQEIPAAVVADAAAAGVLAGVDLAQAPVVPMVLPTYSAELRPDLQAQLDAARVRYEEGEAEMDLAAYERVQRQVNAENLSWQAGNARWEAEQQAFFGKFGQYGQPGPLADALAGEITRIDATAEGKALSGIELLMAAKTRVETALGLMPKPAAPGAQQQQQKPAERPASPRPAPAAHALGAMPAAAAPEVGRGEFTHLDNLNGLDLERAVAALSPEQRERWAAEN